MVINICDVYVHYCQTCGHSNLYRYRPIGESSGTQQWPIRPRVHVTCVNTTGFKLEGGARYSLTFAKYLKSNKHHSSKYKDYRNKKFLFGFLIIFKQFNIVLDSICLMFFPLRANLQNEPSLFDAQQKKYCFKYWLTFLVSKTIFAPGSRTRRIRCYKSYFKTEILGRLGFHEHVWNSSLSYLLFKHPAKVLDAGVTSWRSSTRVASVPSLP